MPYSFDAGNRLTSSTTNPYSETTSTSYDAANRVTSVTNGDTSVANYSYDTANRVTEIQTVNSSSHGSVGLPVHLRRRQCHHSDRYRRDSHRLRL